MSILFKNNTSLFLDHKHNIDIFFTNVCFNDYCLSYTLENKLFLILDTKEKCNRKRSYNSEKLRDETLNVKDLFEYFKTEIPTDFKMTIRNKYQLQDTLNVRDYAKQKFEATVFDHIGINGGNNSEVPLKCKIRGDYFLIPPQSRFFCGCVKEQCDKLSGNKFDILIADPPWWNKYIRRLKSVNEKLSYTMMYNEDIASIPVKELLSTNCLVAVWCTNAPSNIEAVKNVIFPQWGVTYITTWYWVKVTVDLEPVCPFSAGHRKQPYERLMLGKVGDVVIPEQKLIVSIPSALHSHKPPLLGLLKPYAKVDNPQVLELFARYLLPNTTSVGFEPLKFQHVSLYNEVFDNKSEHLE